jgi:IclR family transcriptional regulator, acetate operon repressor
VCSMSAVVRTNSSERYALTIAAPTHRFERAREALRATLLRGVSAIEASLGVK